MKRERFPLGVAIVLQKCKIILLFYSLLCVNIVLIFRNKLMSYQAMYRLSGLLRKSLKSLRLNWLNRLNQSNFNASKNLDSPLFLKLNCIIYNIYIIYNTIKI